MVTWAAKELHWGVLSQWFLKSRRVLCWGWCRLKITQLQPASLLIFIRIFLLMADASKQWSGTDRAGAYITSVIYRARLNSPQPRWCRADHKCSITWCNDFQLLLNTELSRKQATKKHCPAGATSKIKLMGCSSPLGNGILQLLMKFYPEAKSLTWKNRKRMPDSVWRGAASVSCPLSVAHLENLKVAN